MNCTHINEVCCQIKISMARENGGSQSVLDWFLLIKTFPQISILLLLSVEGKSKSLGDQFKSGIRILCCHRKYILSSKFEENGPGISGSKLDHKIWLKQINKHSELKLNKKKWINNGVYLYNFSQIEYGIRFKYKIY